MKYTIDENNKPITLESGTWEIDVLSEKLSDLKDKFPVYKVQIIEKTNLLETQPVIPNHSSRLCQTTHILGMTK